MTALQSLTLQSPGTLGLNTEQQDDVLDPRYATEALNCVIDRNGRLAARNGFSHYQATAATGTPTFEKLHSFINSSGSELIVGAAGSKLWNCETNPPTDLTAALTITDDNWQFANFESEVYAYQSGHTPVYWNGTGNFATIASKGTAAGVVNGTACLAAFGRMWVVDPDETTLRYSDLLVPEDFTNGSAGSIDLYTVWTGGDDRITGLAVHNNNLVIFCQNTIVIYANVDDINNLYLVEVIDSTGCIARDSIQNIGSDILFLSKEGVRSLGRTVIQDNMPMQSISKNVRKDIVFSLQNETANLVRSVYNEREGFYIVLFPTLSESYVFDLRLMSQGVVRPTKWDLPAYDYISTQSGDLLIGLSGGFVGKYESYLDFDQTYILKYRSGWIDPDADQGETKFIWKKLKLFLAAEYDTTVTATWSYDYNSQVSSGNMDIDGGSPSEYGTAEYGIAEYGAQISDATLDYHMTRTGNLVRIGVQASINNGNLAFNKIVLYFKVGNKA